MNLKCPICGKDDGTQMYGVVICKAALARANAENEHLQAAIRERDEAKRDLANLLRSTEVAIASLTKERDGAREESKTLRDGLHRAMRGYFNLAELVLSGEYADIARKMAEEFQALVRPDLYDVEDMVPASHAEKVLVSVAKAAARLGAEEMRKAVVSRLRETSIGLDVVGRMTLDYDAKHNLYDRSTGYSEAADDVSTLASPVPGDES